MYKEDISIKKYYDIFDNISDLDLSIIGMNNNFSKTKDIIGVSKINYISIDFTDEHENFVIIKNDCNKQNFIGLIRKLGRENHQNFILYKMKNNEDILLLDLSKHERKTVDTNLGKYNPNNILKYISCLKNKNIIHARFILEQSYNNFTMQARYNNPDLKLKFPNEVLYMTDKSFI